MPEVSLRNVEKSFGGQRVLNDINIEIADREFMVFVGPSGCGKSTLLRTIAGLEKTDGGHISIGDRDVTKLVPARRGVAMVFQSYALYPHMTVAENIGFGLKVAKMPKADIERRVHEAAAILQIENLLQRKPAALSGGQRQRVAIGRSIVRDPQVFLFDEPLSNLDAALRVQMRVELIKLHRKLDATMIYVTHDQTEAMTMADRIVVLNQGRIEQIGSPLELYHRPRNRFVAGFIGSPRMNFLEVPVQGTDADGVTVTLPGDVALSLPVGGAPPTTGAPLTLGIRPEHVLRDGAGADARISGEAMVVEHLGGKTNVHMRLEDGNTIELELPGDSRLAAGDRLEAGVPAARCHLFDDAGTALARRDGAADPAAPSAVSSA